MAPPRIQLEHQRDFTGGLNLSDDPYNLAAEETFDLQNVDIDRRGGFGVRRGTKRFINQKTLRTITATGASRTANVVTAVGLSPLNGDPNGLTPGRVITVDFADNTYDGTFTVVTAAGGGSTATWAQTAADDAAAGAGTILSGTAEPDSGYTFVDTSATRHILAARAGNVQRWDGSAWQHVIAGLVSSGRAEFAEFRNVLYIKPTPGFVPFTWSGSGLATQLTTAIGNYNDDLTAPNNGNFPQCDAIAVHKEVMWAGGVVDTGSVVHNSRVRWSHPGQAQDWRTNDFIDLDPDDEHGVIRALVPFGDRLLVFKDKAIYAIDGVPPAAFSVQNLTKELGTPSAHSVVATETAVFFWDIDKGAWKYDGKNFTWVFEPLFPVIDDAKMTVNASFQVIAEYHNDRLWLSIPWSAPPYQGSFLSLVYAPGAGKKGAWTLHTRTLFGWWVHHASGGGDAHLIGGHSGFVYELDMPNVFEDQIEPSGSLVGIIAWFTTRWFDAKNPAMKKRWKRPVVVMRGGQTQRTITEVLTNYDPTLITKSFDLLTALDGTEGTWDVHDWDEVNWARELTLSGERSVVLRGQPLSGGVSKALRFKNTIQGQDWRIHGLTMKWIPRRIRN